MSKARLWGLRVNHLCHQGHDVRLRNRLAMPDRSRHVDISEVLEILWHEAVPRDAVHGCQYRGIRDVPAAELLFHHSAPCLDVAGILGGFSRWFGACQRGRRLVQLSGR